MLERGYKQKRARESGMLPIRLAEAFAMGDTVVAAGGVSVS